MKRTKLKLLLFIFIFCSMISVTQAATDNERREDACSSISDYGEKTLCYIEYDYNNTPSRCNKNDNKPGVLCSGLVIRGTSSDLNRDFNSWNPSPASITSGGVSFSYLRKDSKFHRLAYMYTTGFIFYPVEFTPSNKDSTIKILCGYPLDSSSDKRSDKGCGPYNDIEISKPCIEQNIDTASQWIDINYKEAAGSHEHICGFTLYSENNTINVTKMFDAMIKSQILLKETSFNEQNELRLATWEQDKQDIPLEAFFYLEGSTVGLESSQKDQSDFYTQYSEVIPIIAISFPSSMEDDVKFYYNKSDQVK